MFVIRLESRYFPMDFTPFSEAAGSIKWAKFFPTEAEAVEKRETLNDMWRAGSRIVWVPDEEVFLAQLSRGSL